MLFRSVWCDHEASGGAEPGECTIVPCLYSGDGGSVRGVLWSGVLADGKRILQDCELINGYLQMKNILYLLYEMC